MTNRPNRTPAPLGQICNQGPRPVARGARPGTTGWARLP